METLGLWYRAGFYSGVEAMCTVRTVYVYKRIAKNFKAQTSV